MRPFPSGRGDVGEDEAPQDRADPWVGLRDEAAEIGVHRIPHGGVGPGHVAGAVGIDEVPAETGEALGEEQASGYGGLEHGPEPRHVPGRATCAASAPPRMSATARRTSLKHSAYPFAARPLRRPRSASDLSGVQSPRPIFSMSFGVTWCPSMDNDW